MNPRRSFVRKIIYVVVIVALILPLFWLSQPATTSSEKGQGGRGGELAQLREKYGLSEARLGDIDPTGQTMKLATLGMRGVATVFLWKKADDFKMKKDWTNLSATLNQLAKLEPHFVSVWRHQAWNLSYNVSTEFDDYRDRYRWVIRGIDFLQTGIRYNRKEPRLPMDVGWYIAQKIGRADESKQFRRLFKEDEDFHGSRAVSERDNWLVGKEWFGKAEDLVDKGAILRGVAPALFYSDKPMCQMDYAEDLENDGIFEEKAKRAWRLAAEEWHDFGARDIITGPEESFRLNDYESLEASVKQAIKDLDALEPGLREKLVQQKREVLTPDERKALDTPPADRVEEQVRLAMLAQGKILVSDSEVAKRISGENQKKAQSLLEYIEKTNRQIRSIGSSRQVVNFNYWGRRAKYEQDPAVLAAREYVYEGDQAFSEANLVKAREAFDKGWAKWREFFDKEEFKDVAKDQLMGEDLLRMFQRYVSILNKRDEALPEDFPLKDIIEAHAERIGQQEELESKVKGTQRGKG